MSRIRSIKPEFWTSAQVLECSRDARLLFIGMWNFCDDAGRHVDNSKQIKAEVFPADDLTVANVRGMIDELEMRGLVCRYINKNQELIQVTGWHHQRIDKPQKPRYPGPDDDGSSNVPRTLQPDPIRSDTIGREGIRSTTAAARPAENGHDETDDVEFEAFKSVYPERNGSQPWGRARRAINARLAEGSTWSEILEGAQRYSAWCLATGKINTETVKQAATFCGPEREYLKPWSLPQSRADARMSGNLEAAAQAKRELFGGAS